MPPILHPQPSDISAKATGRERSEVKKHERKDRGEKGKIPPLPR